jgi:hypothetical protein
LARIAIGVKWLALHMGEAFLRLIQGVVEALIVVGLASTAMLMLAI